MDLEETVQLKTRGGTTLTARRLTLSDAKGLQQFYADLSGQSRDFFLAHGLDDATVRKALTRSEDGEDLVLGLFDGDRQVGYFFLWYFQRPVPLLGIGMLDELHGQGLGRQMMELLIDEARRNGNRGIELTTQMDNERAFALYQKVGFEYYKDVENLQGDGTLEVERAMFFPIAPDAEPGETPHAPPI